MKATETGGHEGYISVECKVVATTPLRLPCTSLFGLPRRQPTTNPRRMERRVESSAHTAFHRLSWTYGLGGNFGMGRFLSCSSVLEHRGRRRRQGGGRMDSARNAGGFPGDVGCGMIECAGEVV
jgi:hypothetical protein